MTESRSFFRRPRFWLLMLIVGFGVAARFYKLSYASTWFDERASIMSAAGHLEDWAILPMGQVMEAPDLVGVRNENSWLTAWRSPDFHPPLYTMVLRWWRDVFGDSDDAARSLSVMASLAAIVLMYDVGNTLAGPGPALWAAAVMAVAYPQIHYAQEARDYALWEMLGLAASAAAARLAIGGAGWRRAIALNLSLIGLMMTHFLAVGTVAAVAIWCGFWLRGRGLRQALVTAAVCFPLAALLAGGIIGQGLRTHHDADWMIENPPASLRTAVVRLAGIPAGFLADPGPAGATAAGAAAVVYVLPLLLARRNPGMLWCGLYLWCGVGLVFGLDLMRHSRALTYDRFTVAASPGLYLMLAILPLRRGLQHVLPVLAIVGCLLALHLGLPAEYDATFKGQWRELGQDLHRVAGRDDLVVFAAATDTFLGDPLKMYEGTAYYCRPIPCRVVLLDGAASPAVEEALRGAAHVWVVAPNGPVDARKFLRGWRVRPATPNRRFAGMVWQAIPDGQTLQ